MAKDKYTIKSFIIPHFANFDKQQKLWDLYAIYQQEFILHTKNYFKSFLNNKINFTSGTVDFSHFGSTKHIKTELNSSYLQGVLNQACATLNNYLANMKINLIIY